jgi:hypothetical protein
MTSLEIRLYHAQKGTKYITEPEGWIGAILGLQRHKIFRSITKYYKSGFRLWGVSSEELDGGRDWCLDLEDEYGGDSTVEVRIRLRRNLLQWYTIFEGEMQLNTFVEIFDFDHVLEVGFSPKGFWTKLMSRLDKPINILSPVSLDGTPVKLIAPQVVTLPSQVIDMKFKALAGAMGIESFVDNPSGPNSHVLREPFYQFGWRDYITEELPNIYGLPTMGGSEIPVPFFSAKYKGTTRFKLSTNAYITDVNWGAFGIAGIHEAVHPYLNVNGVEYPFTIRTGQTYTNGEPLWHPSIIQVSTGDYCEWVVDQTINDLPANSTARVYFKRLLNGELVGFDGDFRWHGSFTTNQFDNVFPFRTYSFTPDVDILSNTVAPDSTAEGFLMHDVGYLLGARLMGLDDKFESNLMGGPLTCVPYVGKGCAYRNVLFKGLNIRGYTLAQKNFFTSMQDYLDVVLPLYNAGMGVKRSPEVIANEQLLIQNDFTLFGNPAIAEPAEPVLTNWEFSGVDEDNASAWNLYQDGLNCDFLTTTSKKVAQVINRNTLPGVYSCDITFLPKSIGGADTANLTIQFLDENGVIREIVTHFLTLATGVVTLNHTFNTEHKIRKIAFILSKNSGVDVGINVKSLTLNGDVLSGGEKVKIEKVEEFFKTDQVSVKFSNVPKITRRTTVEEVYAGSEVEVEEWEPEDISGITIPQANRSWTTTIKTFAQILSIKIKAILADVTLEQARRATVEKDTDYNYDNNTFVLAVVEDGLGGFKAEMNEGFTDVANLPNSATRVNKRHTPGRIMRRWLNVIAGGLKYCKVNALNFGAGEGNYDMISTLTYQDGACADEYSGVPIDEHAAINVDHAKALYIPILYDVECPMNLEEFIKVDEMSEYAIAISQTAGDHALAFIEDLQYDHEAGQCKMAVYFKERFKIKHEIVTQRLPWDESAYF